MKSYSDASLDICTLGSLGRSCWARSRRQMPLTERTRALTPGATSVCGAGRGARAWCAGACPPSRSMAAVLGVPPRRPQRGRAQVSFLISGSLEPVGRAGISCLPPGLPSARLCTRAHQAVPRWQPSPTPPREMPSAVHMAPRVLESPWPSGSLLLRGSQVCLRTTGLLVDSSLPSSCAAVPVVLPALRVGGQACRSSGSGGPPRRTQLWRSPWPG